MTTGRINQIAMPTDEPGDSISRDETNSVLKVSRRDLETELLGALYKGEQSRVTVALNKERDRRLDRGAEGLPGFPSDLRSRVSQLRRINLLTLPGHSHEEDRSNDLH